LKLRGLLISQLARFDDRSTIDRAKRLFDLDESGKAALSSSIRGSVIEAVGTHADRVQFSQLLRRLKAADSEEDRWIFVRALTAGRNAGRARELLSTSLAGVAAPNIASEIPGMVGRHSPFDRMAYNFTLAHWEQLADLAGTIGKTWLLPSAASNFNDLERARRLLENQRRKAGEDGTSPAARTVARIQLLSAVKRRNAAIIQKNLTSWAPAG
jgi:hypothetical protein